MRILSVTHEKQSIATCHRKTTIKFHRLRWAFEHGNLFFLTHLLVLIMLHYTSIRPHDMVGLITFVVKPTLHFRMIKSSNFNWDD